MKIATRFAPSPTGFVHIGSIYQVLFDYTWAKKQNGRFVLRIEDTDQKRFNKDAEDAIYSALSWFGVDVTEGPRNGGDFGPYRQSERLDLYKKYANELIAKGYAYYCFCTPERLQQVRDEQTKNKKVPMYDKHCRNLSIEESKKRVDAGEKHVVRMKIPENQKIVCKDLIRGDIEFDSSGVDDQVILKSDGFPTYHLAVVVDDHLMQITNVVRGPEWISSFPKHKLLYEFFGWQMPEFFHTPMITNMDGAKLSKRQGHSSVDWYRRRGFLPQTVFNFISLLGWSHPEQKEIFGYDEFVKLFDFKDVSAVSPKFDLVKLEWMSGQYMQNLTDGDLITRILEWLDYCINNTKYQGATEYQTEWTMDDYKNFQLFLSTLDNDKKNLFAQITKTRIKKFEDFLALCGFFFREKSADLDLSALLNKPVDEIKAHLTFVYELLNNCEWNLTDLKNIEAKLVARASEINWKIVEIFTPIRFAIFGSKVTPPLFESIYLYGKSPTLKNLSKIIDKL